MQDANIQRAQLLYQQHRYDMAADALRQALGQSPQDAYAHSLLGLCLVHQEKYEDATREAQAAIHLAPDAPFGHYALGVIYQLRNRFPEAEQAARQAIGLVPEDADYWCLLSEALFGREQWEKALDAANSGLEFAPEHTGCINLRAMALVKLGNKMAAAQTVVEDLRRNPHNSLSHANQGWTLLHQNDHKKALEHFAEALRLDPNNEWAQQGMMQALKARHLLYRLMLRYYLWMSRFTRRGQWGIIIGFWIGAQILQYVKDSYPGLAPFIYPLLIAYGIFVLAGWLADPVFNIALMLNRFGRYLLRTAQKVGAILVAGLLLTAIVLIPMALLIPNDGMLLAGLLAVLLTLPVAATFRCRERGQLLIMGIYAGAVALSGIAGILLMAIGSSRGDEFFQIAVWGSVLSSFASNYLAGLIQKR